MTGDEGSQGVRADEIREAHETLERTGRIGGMPSLHGSFGAPITPSMTKDHIYSSARAAVTKYYRLGSSETTKVSLSQSGGWRSELRVQHG